MQFVPTMSAREAAQRMGVKVETLYAYVSRGLLTRSTASDGRSSVFDPREVEALARRGRPRQSSRSTSLNMLVETRLTELTAQGVRYRGRPTADLAVTHTFEQVAELLWVGRMGAVGAPWPGDRLPFPGDPTRSLVESMAVSVALAGAGAGRGGPASSAVGTSTVRPERGGGGAGRGGSVFSAMDGFTLRPEGGGSLLAGSVAATGRWLIGSVVDSLPSAGRGSTVPRLALPGRAAVARSIAGRLWTRLSPRRPPPGMLAVVNAALVLLADHDLAASTFGVRVAASTRADPAACVAAGLGVLQGPLHGGASVQARELIEDASTVGASRAVGRLVEQRRRVPGFGHKVYTDTDPRAVVLLRLLGEAAGTARVLRVVDDVRAETMARTGQAANVDLALAAVGLANGMAPDAGEAIMATARMAGWLAHAIEEYAEAPLRFRPRALYVG